MRASGRRGPLGMGWRDRIIAGGLGSGCNGLHSGIVLVGGRFMDEQCRGEGDLLGGEEDWLESWIDSEVGGQEEASSAGIKCVTMDGRI